MTAEGNDFPQANESAWSKWLRWGVVVVSALLFAASFPPWEAHGGAVAFISLTLFFSVLPGTTAPRARALGFVWGMLAYGVSLSWFWGLFQASAIGLWALLSLYLAFFAGLQSLAWRKGVRRWKWVAFTMVNWVGWEFLRCELLPLNFPWMTPAMAVGPNALLPWIGAYGVSAVMVLWAAVASWAVVTGRFISTFAGVLVFTALGWPRAPELPTPAHAIAVAMVQNESVSFDECMAQTAKLPGNVKLVLWPEYALPYDVRNNRRDMGLLQKICKERGTTLVVGTQTTPKGGKQWFNTALTLNENGISGEHHKVHPVHLFNDGTPGTTRLPVKSTLGVMGTPICFDCDYQDVVRRMTAAGAEFFAVPSMDAVSWSERQHRQHAVLFQMRACENGRWFAVCASSGVSQIIDPHGMVSGSLPPLVTGELVGTLERRTGLTFFTRMGWLAPWMMLGAASVCWLAILFPHGKRR